MKRILGAQNDAWPNFIRERRTKRPASAYRAQDTTTHKITEDDPLILLFDLANFCRGGVFLSWMSCTVFLYTHSPTFNHCC